MSKFPIIIDPEFAALIPLMAPAERAQLKESIRTKNLRDPILLWCGDCGDKPQNGRIVIDGHNRLEVLKEIQAEGVKREDASDEPFVYELDFSQVDADKDARAFPYRFVHGLKDREAVKLWILENQVGRRNISKEQRIEMVAKIVVLRKKASAEIQKANLKQGTKIPDKKSPEVTKTVTSGKKTVAAAAEEFQVPRKPLQAAVNKAEGKPNRAIYAAPHQPPSPSIVEYVNHIPVYQQMIFDLREWMDEEIPIAAKRIHVKVCGHGHGAGMGQGLKSGELKQTFDAEFRDLTIDEIKKVSKYFSDERAAAVLQEPAG